MNRRRLFNLLLLTTAMLAPPSAAAQQQDAINPVNRLERALYKTQFERGDAKRFFEVLYESDVIVLVTEDVLDTSEPEDLRPLAIPDEQGGRRIATFTSPQRASRLAKLYPKYRYGLLTDFAWVVHHITAGLGIVMNPGWAMGMNIPSYGVLKMKEEVPEPIGPFNPQTFAVQ